MADDNRYRWCAHESGHALIALELGMDLRWAEVYERAKSGSWGECVVHGLGQQPIPKVLLLKASGPAAEGLLLGSMLGGSGDLSQARRLVEQHYHVPGDGEEADRILVGREVSARAKLQLHRKWLKAVALRLVHRGFLNAAEITALNPAAVRPPAPPAAEPLSTTPVDLVGWMRKDLLDRSQDPHRSAADRSLCAARAVRLAKSRGGVICKVID